MATRSPCLIEPKVVFKKGTLHRSSSVDDGANTISSRQPCQGVTGDYWTQMSDSTAGPSTLPLWPSTPLLRPGTPALSAPLLPVPVCCIEEEEDVPKETATEEPLLDTLPDNKQGDTKKWVETHRSFELMDVAMEERLVPNKACNSQMSAFVTILR